MFTFPCLTTAPAKPARPLIDRPVDLLLFIYFVVHVPIILFIDSQNILPTQFFPGFLRSILRSWVDASGDPFVQMDPGPLDPNLIWFSTIVTIEMLFHVPFNCYAAYELYRDSPCFDLPLLMMGVHSATFVVPMVASLWLGFPQLTLDQRFTLTKMYGPYVFITIGMAVKGLRSIIQSAQENSDAGQKSIATKKGL